MHQLHKAQIFPFIFQSLIGAAHLMAMQSAMPCGNCVFTPMATKAVKPLVGRNLTMVLSSLITPKNPPCSKLRGRRIVCNSRGRHLCLVYQERPRSILPAILGREPTPKSVPISFIDESLHTLHFIQF